MSGSLNLDLIRTDGGTQPRSSMFMDTVDAYIEDMAHGAVFPPVVVFYDGESYWLADGFHRYHATQALQRETIEADVRQGTQRDAVLYSLGANAAHGRPRTADDKRRAVKLLLADPEWSGWSDREIARRCRTSHTFVSGLRPKVHTGNVATMGPAVRTFVHHKTGQPAGMTITNGVRPREEKPVLQITVAPQERQQAEPVQISVRAPSPTPEQIAAFKARMAQDGPIADAVREIVEAFAALPEAPEAARRYPPVLRHAFSGDRARFIGQWFLAFAEAWERENGGAHVAA